MKPTALIFAALILSQLGAISTASTAASAQGVKRDLLGSYRNWDALVRRDAKTGKACYMISVPIKSTASKAKVSRGDIYITLTHRPKYAIKNELNVVFGYPMAEGAEVTLNVDGRTRKKFFTEKSAGGNSVGWAYDPKDDSAMAAAMKRGSRLRVDGASARGTRTTDTYSLSGFTAAYNAITKACG